MILKVSIIIWSSHTTAHTQRIALYKSYPLLLFTVHRVVQFEIYFPMWRYVDNLMKKGNKIILKKMKKLIKKTKNLGGLGKKVGGKAKQSQILQLY